MPIIINEFEILPEPSRERPPAAGQPQAEPELTVPEPMAILRVQRLFWQRRRRLWAD